jgi:polysaccharide pyruvyl transferase WcaK-like protein
MKVGLIDPAQYTHDGVPSPNIGDQVIARAVHRELRHLFGEQTDIVVVPSHKYPTRDVVQALSGASHVFVGGSNLLSFRWWWRTPWKIGLRGLLSYRDLILMGTGWGSYHLKANAYGRGVCRTVLSGTHTHSVRDSFTARIMSQGLELPHVVNTACPTMWALTEHHVASIPRDKAPDCLFALTDYSRKPTFDRALVHSLAKFYGPDRLLFWPQGTGDLEYARSLGYTGRVIERSLASLIAILSSGSRLDYIGTRLHAGILCMEHGVRSLIVSIDNRAREIASDTGLPTIDRPVSEAALAEWILGGAHTRLHLPWSTIDAWRRQFMTGSPATSSATP